MTVPPPPSCRLCGESLSEVFADLGTAPPSNAYLTRAELRAAEKHFELCAYVCHACFLVQLAELEKAEDIFGDEYLYFSSYSPSWLNHCRNYASDAIERFHLGSENLVVEIASNDGYLLQYFRSAAIPVLGVEPARNVAEVAISERGIPTEIAFFGRSLAEEMVARGTRADLLIGNNVLAHVPDLHDFLIGVSTLLDEEGVATVEFPHLQRLVEQRQFDTIYHEHFSYFSFLTASRAFADHGLRVFDVEELRTHGGSLRVYVCHDSSSHRTTPAVESLHARERDLGYHSLDRYRAFEEEIFAIKRDVLRFLLDLREEGRKVAAYGAAAKGNTLLNFCGIRRDLVSFVVDRSPHKQGRYLPGSRIPILPPSAIESERPDYVLILPWNLKSEIAGQLGKIREWGGRCVVAIPHLEVF